MAGSLFYFLFKILGDRVMIVTIERLVDAAETLDYSMLKEMWESAETPAEKALFFARDDLFQGTLLHAAVHGAVGFSAQAMDGAFLEKTKHYQETIQFLTELEKTQYRENLMQPYLLQPYLLQPYLLGKRDSCNNTPPLLNVFSGGVYCNTTDAKRLIQLLYALKETLPSDVKPIFLSFLDVEGVINARRAWIVQYFLDQNPLSLLANCLPELRQRSTDDYQKHLNMAMSLACRGGHTDIAEQLYLHGASLSSKEQEKTTLYKKPLSCAIEHLHQETADWLIKQDPALFGRTFPNGPASAAAFFVNLNNHLSCFDAPIDKKPDDERSDSEIKNEQVVDLFVHCCKKNIENDNKAASVVTRFIRQVAIMRNAESERVPVPVPVPVPVAAAAVVAAGAVVAWWVAASTDPENEGAVNDCFVM
jgi:hypothetical protein